MSLQVKNEILIHASAAHVWEVLTQPEYTKQYMFGCATESDWKEGSSLLWKMIHEGKELVPVKGIIKEINPKIKLVYTVTDPNAGWEDIPENYLNVTYTLMQHDEKTLLTVMQDGFENAAEGEKRYKDVYNNGEGWMPMLVEIKKVAEESKK